LVTITPFVDEGLGNSSYVVDLSDGRGLDDEEEVDLGGLTLRAIGTAGHAPEHLAYVLLDGGQAAGQPSSSAAPGTGRARSGDPLATGT
jgi:glyoxylase-like metal-dependent hydrolase (beta-lactamase superfamily II)